MEPVNPLRALYHHCGSNIPMVVDSIERPIAEPTGPL